MRRFLGYLLSPIHHLFFFLILCIFQPLQWLCLKVSIQTHKKCVDALNFCLSATYYLIAVPIRFINKQKLPTNQPIIFVANHQSMYDIPAMYWFLRKHSVKFISKIELAKNIPSISFNLRHGGGANIDRNDPRQAVGEILKLGQRMKDNNWSVIIFPEGTRSKDGKLKDFQSGGVATLLKKNPDSLVVPIAINNSFKIVKNGTFWLMPGYIISFNVLEPIVTKAKTVDEIMLQTKNAIQNNLY